MKTFHIPLWIVLSAHSAIALGTLSGGWRIVKTMGQKIVKLQPIDGFCAETASAISIFFATHLGVPVSTTHVITGAVAGVGTAKNAAAVKWQVTIKIVWAWILTIPAAALCAGVGLRGRQPDRQMVIEIRPRRQFQDPHPELNSRPKMRYINEALICFPGGHHEQIRAGTLRRLSYSHYACGRRLGPGPGPVAGPAAGRAARDPRSLFQHLVDGRPAHPGLAEALDRAPSGHDGRWSAWTASRSGSWGRSGGAFPP